MSVSFDALSEPFDRLASALPFAISELQKQQLIGFVVLIHKWNKTYNLTSVRDPQEMLVKHIFDSLAVYPHLQGARIADVGTGPGLPGIPLAIMCPDKQFTLIDSLGKRIRFIKQSVYELKISNVRALQNRVEQLTPDEPFDVVLSRAFASLKDMLHWCQHLVNSDGQFLALKGQLLADEIQQLPEGFALLECIELQVPSLDAERHAVKIVKLA